ncbi:apicoplast ribosomal protein S5, putative (apicoplast) [Plasmodium relictum]|uniref:Apicoplast ribosomal protein S5, putative n=1 Tax=Plasmodium relictum TaxID=85471 RepID=A0A1J1HBS4_PLARL|nr:apicoplast ribosomal protein S5, putative [Plasmodium relictum]CRH02953.1 apicoplast ribosomal protein S5, putative [Plasmodium relictum]
MNLSVNKINNYYILYYILVLLKSLFILIYKNKLNKIYIYKIFYVLIIYCKLFYIIKKLNYNNNLNNIIFNIYNINYIYFYIYKYKFLNKVIKNNNIYNVIIDKIISINKISYTVKKGRIKRYKVILLVGNKLGWVGIGVGKNNNINKAIILAKINALNNIYYFKYSILNIYKLKYVYISSNKFLVKFQFKIYNYLNIKFLLFKYLLECLGYLNCKIIIYYNVISNKYNLLNKLIFILFNFFN